MNYADTPRILIVEDDPAMRDLLELALKQQFVPPFELKIAQNGLEALDIIQEQPPALIILDILLPQMNGLQLLQQIQDYPNRSDIRVVIISALGVREVVQQAIDGGANDFIVKPFDMDTFIARVQAVLRG
ncbi:MAG: response regulator transcription factor [Anaerolineales bacterium]